jgi:hypothetical protein
MMLHLVWQDYDSTQFNKIVCGDRVITPGVTR